MLALKDYVADMEEDKGNTVRFHIYGTGIVGVSVYVALKTLYHVTPVSFLITNGKNNPAQIEQIPVQEAAGASLGEDLILVAVPVEHHESIGAKLHDLGVSENSIIFVDSALENHIMEDYYASLPAFETAGQYLKGRQTSAGSVGGDNSCGEKAGYHQSDICIYQAKCHVDRPLINGSVECAYICPIQVGADLTEQSVADLKDNTGDHISWKNHDYCELTATYYAWKNSTATYKGLYHYRRVFALNDAEIERLLGDVDVILPYPTIHLPNISLQHSRYISEPEWRAMRRGVEAYAPSYVADFDRIFSDRYFYNFNMLVAKAAVFDDYARWLFGILARTEELIAEEGIVTTKRYAGYLGENLTTLYFRRNRNHLKIVHAGKLQLE